MKIDDRVVNHVNFLVDEGVYNVGEVKRNIRMFVKELFTDNTLPGITTRKFYPSRADIRKMIYRQRQRLANGLVDEQLLAAKVAQWQQNAPGSKFLLRHACTDVQSRQTFLFVYQADWQRRLLLRYGNDLVLLDATYKTTQYALPLFFLCVKTNVGYCVVGTFIVQNEDTFAVSEALQILRDTNQDWKPAAFMIDASEVEMNAIATVFPG